MHTTFGSDRPYLYTVEPWKSLGFGVANFGNNPSTLSKNAHYMADMVGRFQLLVMTHIDAQRTQPPSINTVIRFGKMLNRVRTLLSSRAKGDADLRLEEGHATATAKPWRIHPVPYFDGVLVRNPWLDTYNELLMVALTNIYQHSDNNLSLTVTQKFAQDIWQYFREIQFLMGTELLGIPAETIQAPGFVFEESHYQAYNPSELTLNMEPLDSPGPVHQRMTEDDLRPLMQGYNSHDLIPVLVQYPAIKGITEQGAPLPEEAIEPSIRNDAFVSADELNDPQI